MSGEVSSQLDSMESPASKLAQPFVLDEEGRPVVLLGTNGRAIPPKSAPPAKSITHENGKTHRATSGPVERTDGREKCNLRNLGDGLGVSLKGRGSSSSEPQNSVVRSSTGETAKTNGSGGDEKSQTDER